MESELYGVNDRVRICCKDGRMFEGVVYDFSQEAQRICLKDVIQLPDEVHLEGLKGFEGHEILTIKHLENENDTDEEETDHPTESQNSAHGEQKISEEEYSKILKLQQNYRFINNVTSNFYSAISLLKNCDILGICVKDTSKGRHGRASVIAVATDSFILIFDLATIGDRIFDLGLREIFQSADITKVVYDCRQVSDCLFHKHQVALENVRDVEAEDVMVVHQQRGYIRKHSRTFSYLVAVYLGLDDVLCDGSKFISWKKRPLEISQLDYLAIYTSFLIPLHKEIEREYLRRLIDASKIYNKYFRDSDIEIYITECEKYVSRKPIFELVRYKKVCGARKHS